MWCYLLLQGLWTKKNNNNKWNPNNKIKSILKFLNISYISNNITLSNLWNFQLSKPSSYTMNNEQYSFVSKS